MNSQLIHVEEYQTFDMINSKISVEVMKQICHHEDLPFLKNKSNLFQGLEDEIFGHK